MTDCRKRAHKEAEFIVHMEDHLADMNSEEILQNRIELVPVKGRPPHASQSANLSLGLPSSAFGRTIKSLDEVDDSVDSDPAPTNGKLAEDEADEAEEKQNQTVRDILFCQDCDLTFDKLSTGFRHQIDVHNKDLKSCPVCWRRLADTQELVDHVVQAHDDAVGKKRKRTLDKSFSFGDAQPKSKEISTDSTNSTSIHSSSTAPLSTSAKTLDLSCRTCKAKHVNYSELLKHQHYVHGTTDKRCRLCNKFINSYPSLIGHVNTCKRVWFTNP